jgi:drug/metabolite transporter (DMT)-like permease
VQSGFFTLTIFIFAAFSSGIKFHNTDVTYGLLAAVFGFTGVTIMLHSLSHRHASVNYAVFRSSFVFSSAAAIVFLSEALSFGKIAAVIAACGAIVLFFFRPKQHLTANRSLMLALLAMLTAAGYQFIVKISTYAYSSPLSFILLMTLFFTTFVVVYNIVLRNWRFPKQTFVWAPINGILAASATFFYVTALHKGELSTSIPIIQLSFIITAILSFVFLKERLYRMKIAGIILAALAIIILGTL